MTTDITELAQSMKAAATNVKETAHIARYLKATIARQTFKELMTPENILALVEALEKAQRYIEELREWNAGLAQESFERQQRIAELESRTVTVENLQESAYRAGLTAGWNLGLANNNDGFNKCLAAHTAGIKVEAE
ncbi:ead/Ea22-like family protein [Klebsiella pneumoniae]|uniref:ead/Ea22-like family protein n=1 Tax=Klebsiella pneumoniae TaxID=573 RepID=UPI002731EACA|nr:ead/Ea22-like family protein [Klebsiella pneumoniae]MDP1178799.1 ead/Ea22-like family protein [Klebsiella pneumoniae]HBW2841690.1 ead/Ea22-like family protein [Klebsiella pneumoniae]HDY9286363.1 ead/Ea22-like family protein [Klebsiella pneumoniae]